MNSTTDYQYRQRTFTLREINYSTLLELVPKSGKLYVGYSGHYYQARPWGVCQFVIVRREKQIILRLHGGRCPLLTWYPDGRLVVGALVQLYKDGEGVGVPVEFWRLVDRPDLFEVMKGDVYFNKEPMGDAKLLPAEAVRKLERQANHLASQVLPPQTRYDWWCSAFRNKQRFILQPRQENLPASSLRYFNEEMHRWCETSGISLPKGRNRKPVSGITSNSCIESLFTDLEGV